MLVLKRKIGESIVIGTDGEITVTLLDKQGDQISVGVEAARSVPVHRQEVYLEQLRAKRR